MGLEPPRRPQPCLHVEKSAEGILAVIKLQIVAGFDPLARSETGFDVHKLTQIEFVRVEFHTMGLENPPCGGCPHRRVVKLAECGCREQEGDSENVNFECFH